MTKAHTHFCMNLFCEHYKLCITANRRYFISRVVNRGSEKFFSWRPRKHSNIKCLHYVSPSVLVFHVALVHLIKADHGIAGICSIYVNIGYLREAGFSALKIKILMHT